MASELEIAELEDTIERQANLITTLRAEVDTLRAALIHARGQMQHPDQMIDEALGDNGLPALGEGKKG